MEYTVLKQKRKTATIVISNELKVVVKVPNHVTRKQIESLVKQNEDWILTVLEKKKNLIETKDWYRTKRLLYLGKYWPVEMIISSVKKSKVDFTDKGFIIVSDGNELNTRKLVEKFYREQAKKMLLNLANQYAQIIGVNFQKITIRNQVTRWGSCSSKGNLSFNLKILCAPIEMIEYVVLHEVMHLKHFNHSKDFWQDIEELMPDYKIRMNYFKEYGQNFMI
ncbi:MAG: M48 family metallopeptidase [Cellulosilyticum sp.]|nr:M48 family metallopeptidase [Cellulosilyticum sp.]